MRLKDKVALITGAAAGIGKATALKFAKEGAALVLTDVNENGVKQLAKEIEQAGGKAIGMGHDVTSEQAWVDVVQAAVKTYGTLDILFNNAGIYVIKPLVEITLEEWNRLMAINVTGVFLGMKHAIPVMAKQHKGSVINASSIAGLKGAAGHALYGASKGAVRIMTKDVAMEYAGNNVRVNSIHPGYIQTEMVEYASKTTGKAVTELAQAYPLKQIGTPDGVASLVLFLASDESSFITGAEYVIDGGVTAQ